MTLDKAIEILSQDLAYTYPAKFNDLQDAINLGREALKEVREARLMNNVLPHTLLPGETND